VRRTKQHDDRPVWPIVVLMLAGILLLTGSALLLV
jgi:serine/threonine-protein kinase